MAEEKVELQEVRLVEEDESLAVPEENPKLIPSLHQFTAGANMKTVAGGVIGAIVGGVIPKVVKWDTGVKDVIATLATTLVGGYLLSRWDKQVALGWVIGGSIITIFKAARMLMPGKLPLLGGDLIYGDEFEDFFMGEGDNVFTEEELFGVGEDPIIPTAGDEF